MKRPRAMTLLEVVFVTGLMGLFVLMVSRALVMGFRAHKKTMERTAAQRQGAVAMSRMLRELSMGFRWNAPAIGSPTVHPTAPGQLSWQRTVRGTGPSLGLTTKRVQYWLDVDSHELRKEDTTLGAGYRVVARDVVDFRVDVQTDRVKVALETKDNGVPLVVVGHPINM